MQTSTNRIKLIHNKKFKINKINQIKIKEYNKTQVLRVHLPQKVYSKNQIRIKNKSKKIINSLKK